MEEEEEKKIYFKLENKKKYAEYLKKEKKYKHLECIGEGGQAKVKKIFGENLAIKTYDKCDVKSFYREVVSMIKCNNDFIIKLRGFNIYLKTENAIILPYYEKKSLKDNYGGLNPTTKTKIAAAIAYGMCCIHNLYICHRDLKDSNILLTNEKDPVICDFGIAKLHQLTQTQTNIGTYLFLAPEILYKINNKPKHQYGKAADVYAYGVLLYQILNNGKIKKFSENELEEMKTNGTFLKDDSDENKSVKELIYKCLTTDPFKRIDFQEVFNEFKEGKVAFDGTDKKEFKKYLKEKILKDELTIPEEEFAVLFLYGRENESLIFAENDLFLFVEKGKYEINDSVITFDIEGVEKQINSKFYNENFEQEMYVVDNGFIYTDDEKIVGFHFDKEKKWKEYLRNVKDDEKYGKFFAELFLITEYKGEDNTEIYDSLLETFNKNPEYFNLILSGNKSLINKKILRSKLKDMNKLIPFYFNKTKKFDMGDFISYFRNVDEGFSSEKIIETSISNYIASVKKKNVFIFDLLLPSLKNDENEFTSHWAFKYFTPYIKECLNDIEFPFGNKDFSENFYNFLEVIRTNKLMNEFKKFIRIKNEDELKNYLKINYDDSCNELMKYKEIKKKLEKEFLHYYFFESESEYKKYKKKIKEIDEASIYTKFSTTVGEMVRLYRITKLSVE